MQMIDRKCIYDSSLPYVRYKNLPNINLNTVPFYTETYYTPLSPLQDIP